MGTLKSVLLGVSLVFASTTSAVASVQDAVSTLGFETVNEWTIRNGTVIGSSPNRTQGAAALAIRPSGYTVLTSRLLGPLGQVMPTVSFDCF